MKFVIEGQPIHIKIVQHHVYLGSVVSYGKFEAQTFGHRLQLAKGSYSRLGTILRNRSVPLRLRLQLWQGCIWPTLLHALDCCGLPEKEMQAMMVALVKQARSIARSHSMLTKENTVDLIKRLKLPNPVRRLQQTLTRRLTQDLSLGPLIQPGEQQLQWRHLVRGHLFVWGVDHAPPVNDCRLVPIHEVIHETFACDTCGQTFSTQAALRRHCYVHHLDEDQQQERDVQSSEARKESVREHAEAGMPKCRHCRHEFTTWHAFFYHINSRSCPILRAIYSKSTSGFILHHMNESLVMSEQLLDLARDCSWQQLALHPLVQQKHHHCAECNHWSVRPQYVRRHMLSQHPECSALMQSCVEFIKDSRLSLQNPCQFCHQTYNRADAHLRSCMGIFQGVYLHCRLARGRNLQPVSQIHDVWTGTQCADRAPRSDQGAGPPQDSGASGRAVQCTISGRKSPDGGKTGKMVQTGPKRGSARQGPRTEGPLARLFPAQGMDGDAREGNRTGLSRRARSTWRRTIRRCTQCPPRRIRRSWRSSERCWEWSPPCY